MDKNSKFISITFISISSISLISKAVGFVREIVLSHFFGTEAIADAYIMSGNIVGVLFGWVSTIYVCYTPVFARIVKSFGKNKGIDFTRTLITVFEIIAIICICFVQVFSKSIVSIIAPGFSGELLELASSFLKSSSWILLAQPFIYPFKAYLEYEQKFVPASFSDMSVSILQVIIISISGLVSYKFLPYAMSIPYIIQGIILLCCARLNGLKYYPQLKCMNEMKSLFRVLVPYFLSSLLIEINSFVDRYFASSMNQGSVSMLNYASILNSFLLNIFIMAVSVMIYPSLTKAFVNKNFEKFNQTLKYGLSFIIIIFIPILMGALSLSNEIVFCVYGHGAFDANSVKGTSTIFSILAIALPALAIRELLFKSLYAGANTRIPFVSGIAATIINVFLNLLLAPQLGVIGLALATTLSVIITVPILAIVMIKKSYCFPIGCLLMLILKSLLSSALMLFAIFIYKHFVSFDYSSLFSSWLRLIGCIGVSVIVYFGTLMLLRIKGK
ncbi:murein biosynthesis integral membrane protein MurJ [Hungatella hathewayi]|uniref:Lipid II flippase MurJ n=1 Tax=Hungatella hathewayi WAL-18680 TaxID=742737 RepID=G5IB56_9FIRM|nr:lipid II flippase MurJ [Hungatella hathewayi]EHI61371.1 hypothetical protein HMPREF9473_00733 [ [Hungatella hathewayi WAL-18680]